VKDNRIEEMMKHVEALEIKLNYTKQDNCDLKTENHQLQEKNRFLMTGKIKRDYKRMEKKCEEEQIEKNMLVEEVKRERTLREQAKDSLKNQTKKNVDLESKLQKMEYSKNMIQNENEEVRINSSKSG
jgi:hypothetical protein